MTKNERKAMALIFEAERRPHVATSEMYQGNITQLATSAEVNRWLVEGSDYQKGWEACHAQLRDRISFLMENPEEAISQLKKFAET